MTALALLLLAPSAPDPATESKLALAPLNPLIGQWRGVAQPRRGSAAGAWREAAEWVWDFSDPAAPAVRLDVTDGQELSSLTVAGNPAGFRLTLSPPTGEPATLTAPSLGDKAVFGPTGDGRDRITLRILNDDRFTLLLERRRTPTGRFRRVYEAGYTRSGVRLAERGVGGPECVVTGGLGTIAVTHAGETFFVCCTGCVAAFEADPAGVLEEYRAKKAAEKDAR